MRCLYSVLHHLVLLLVHDIICEERAICYHLLVCQSVTWVDQSKMVAFRIMLTDAGMIVKKELQIGLAAGVSLSGTPVDRVIAFKSHCRADEGTGDAAALWIIYEDGDYTMSLSH